MGNRINRNRPCRIHIAPWPVHPRHTHSTPTAHPYVALTCRCESQLHGSRCRVFESVLTSSAATLKVYLEGEQMKCKLSEGYGVSSQVLSSQVLSVKHFVSQCKCESRLHTGFHYRMVQQLFGVLPAEMPHGVEVRGGGRDGRVHRRIPRHRHRRHRGCVGVAA